MKKLLLFLLSPLLMHGLNAQNDTCRVLHEKLAGAYTGGCENGLASGKGKATGEDTYTGAFLNGLPHGKGTYTFKNGNVFKGRWVNGQKNGKGTFKYTQHGKQHTLSGYWKDDVYAGATDPGLSYRVGQSTGIPVHRVTEEAVPDAADSRVVFAIQVANTDFAPSDLKIEHSSGQLTQLGRRFSVSRCALPLRCELSYTMKAGLSRMQCRFIIDILQPGAYTVTLDHN